MRNKKNRKNIQSRYTSLTRKISNNQIAHNKENTLKKKNLLNESFLPEIKNIKMKLNNKKKRENRSELFAESMMSNTARKEKKKGCFVEVFVRVRPFLSFEFRDKHQST